MRFFFLRHTVNLFWFIENKGYWKLNGMPGSSECLRQKHQFLNFWGKAIWENYGKQVMSKMEREVSNRWNYIHKKGVIVIGWDSRALNFETKTLDKSNLNFDKQLCYCICLCEIFEVNYLRGRYEQLPLYLSLFFAFSSEALNSGVKSCFVRAVFQYAVCEEFFSIRLWCLQL